MPEEKSAHILLLRGKRWQDDDKKTKEHDESMIISHHPGPFFSLSLLQKRFTREKRMDE
jgi:hypothetical protein